jgi:cytochrome P450
VKSNPSIRELARAYSAGKQLEIGTRLPGPKARVYGRDERVQSRLAGIYRAPATRLRRHCWSRFLYVPALFLYHPNEIEYVLTTNARNFVKAMTLRSNFFQRLVGNGLLTSEGEEWKRQRRLTSPAFHRHRIANYADTMIELHQASDFIMDRRRNARHARDMMRSRSRSSCAACSIPTFPAMSIASVKPGELVKPFAAQATLKWISE